MIERHVKPLYEKEEKRQRRGDGTRSETLNQRIKNVLKMINEFNRDETDEPGGEPQPEPEREEPIYFAANTIRLKTGEPKRVFAFVNLEKVKSGEVILFESSNPEIKVEPDSEMAKPLKGKKHQRVDIQVTCSVKGQKGTITALTVLRDGEEYQAELQIIGVDDPPIFVPPDDIEFTASHFSGQPNRQNKATLLVNLDAFSGMPEITFYVESSLGNVMLGEDGVDRLRIKVSKDMVMTGRNVARVNVPFKGTGWGQHAILCAKTKRRDGEVVHAKCRVRFERPLGRDKFSNFHYEDLQRKVLGDVAGDKLYINAGYGFHRQIFGETEDDFNKQLESNSIAQMRAASVLVDTVVHHAATVKLNLGGQKGLHIDQDDPIGSFRTYFDENRMKLEQAVYRALAPDVARPD